MEYLSSTKKRLSEMGKVQKSISLFFTVLVAVVLLGSVIAYKGANIGTDQLASSAASSIIPPEIDSSWRFTFDDEFNGSSLNTGLWADGGQNWGSGGNGEQEGYTLNACNEANGILQIQGSNKTVTINGTTHQYTSCMIDTIGKFKQSYGYFEFNGEIPKGQGYWPAFWMYDSNYSAPEIDTMENLGNDTSTYYMTYHDNSGQQQHAYSGVDLSAGYHTYGVLWEPGEIKFYLDDTLQYTVTSGVTSDPMFILVNLAIGGNWPGSPNSSTVFPGDFNVDWIRGWSMPTDTSNPVVPYPANTGTTTPTATATPTAKPTVTATPTPTSKPTTTSTPTVTAKPTNTALPTVTVKQTTTPTPTSVPVPTGSNLILNGSFEIANQTPWYSPWGFNKYGGGTATLTEDTSTAVDGSASAKIDVTKSGSNPWDVQLEAVPHVSNGTSYTVSFWAKASKTVTGSQVLFQQNGGSYPVYDTYNFTPTTSWQKYSFVYTPTASGTTELLNFNIGSTVATYWIDAVSMESLGSVTATPITITPVKTSPTLVTTTPKITVTVTPTDAKTTPSVTKTVPSATIASGTPTMTTIVTVSPTPTGTGSNGNKQKKEDLFRSFWDWIRSHWF